MYAIVREGNGRFYTSMVFGYYNIHDVRYWIILNKEKTRLIKQHMLQPDTKYLIPTVLVTDADESNWIKESETEEAVDFLPVRALPAMIDAGTVPEVLTQQCIELDRAYRFEEIREVNTEEDIRDLEWASAGFHDGYISELHREGDTLRVLFDGTWSRKVEVWFEGDVAYDTTSRNPETEDPYWMDSKVLIHDGFIYLIDDENAQPEKLGQGYCWFKARHMKYRIIPD